MRVIADVKASGNVLIATTPYKVTIEDGKYEINIKPFERLKRSQRHVKKLMEILKITTNSTINY